MVLEGWASHFRYNDAQRICIVDHVTLLKYQEHVITWLIRIEDDNQEEVTNQNAIHNLMPHPQRKKRKTDQTMG